MVRTTHACDESNCATLRCARGPNGAPGRRAGRHRRAGRPPPWRGRLRTRRGPRGGGRAADRGWSALDELLTLSLAKLILKVLNSVTFAPRSARTTSTAPCHGVAFVAARSLRIRLTFSRPSSRSSGSFTVGGAL